MVGKHLTFGVSAGHGGASLLEGARNVVAILGARIGRTVRLLVLDSYPALEAAVASSAAHAAWLPPMVHVRATAAGAHLVAVPERGGSVVYRSALLVRADAAWTAAVELAGKRAAWTDPSSAAGMIFPRRHLAGVALDSEAMKGSFRSACGAVADGDADVCGCFVSEAAMRGGHTAILAEVAKVYPPAPWRLKVLAVTDPIPPDGIVVAAAVEAPLREAMTAALLGMGAERTGADALEKMLSARKLVAPDEHVLALLAAL